MLIILLLYKFCGFIRFRRFLAFVKNGVLKRLLKFLKFVKAEHPRPPKEGWIHIWGSPSMISGGNGFQIFVCCVFSCEKLLVKPVFCAWDTIVQLLCLVELAIWEKPPRFVAYTWCSPCCVYLPFTSSLKLRLRLSNSSFKIIWRFPEMVLLPNHAF